jgi:hypothetical protein
MWDFPPVIDGRPFIEENKNGTQVEETMLTIESGRSQALGDRLYRVCWKSSVTRIHGRSAPMSREQAEFLAHDESIGTASCQFWIEPLVESNEEQRSPIARHAAKKTVRAGVSRQGAD